MPRGKVSAKTVPSKAKKRTSQQATSKSVKMADQLSASNGLPPPCKSARQAARAKNYEVREVSVSQGNQWGDSSQLRGRSRL